MHKPVEGLVNGVVIGQLLLLTTQPLMRLLH